MTHFLQAAGWSFARLGILGVGLCGSANTPRRLLFAPHQIKNQYS